MQLTKKTTRVFTTLVMCGFISVAITACGGSETKTDQPPADSVGMQSAPVDSMPPIDTSADTRPEGTRTKAQK